ncbi:MAG: efflux transporter outer membrane subunit, partial [Mailhella sp.]|nr:efflux transporter outer membrane subunit [Mailhella sp.]
MRPVSLLRLNSVFALLAVFCLIDGCSLAPEYERPVLPVADVYENDVSGHASAQDSAYLIPGHEFYADETMQKLIDTAFANNRDLRAALLNVERIRAQYRIQDADILPSLGVSAEYAAEHLPAALSRTGREATSRQYTMGLGFSAFELDVFGRVKNLSRAALERFFSAEEENKSARITLASETAALYLQLVADRELYDLTQSTVALRQNEVNLIRTRSANGLASALESAQAETLLHEARAQLAARAVKTEQDVNALELLLGAEIPRDIPETRRLAELRSLPDIPAGLPSDLIENRPDIRAAEHALIGAYADIGAAKANFFPRIALTGSLGQVSVELSSLWKGSSAVWSFMPQVTLPLFDAGRNKALLKISEADRDIAVNRYEKAVQSAFRDVRDALAQRRHIEEQTNAQEALAKACKDTYDYAMSRYAAGLSSFADVLDAQRTLFSAQQGLVAVRLLRESNALNLYKALGGGWQ